MSDPITVVVIMDLVAAAGLLVWSIFAKDPPRYP